MLVGACGCYSCFFNWSHHSPLSKAFLHRQLPQPGALSFFIDPSTPEMLELQNPPRSAVNSLNMLLLLSVHVLVTVSHTPEFCNMFDWLHICFNGGTDVLLKCLVHEKGGVGGGAFTQNILCNRKKSSQCKGQAHNSLSFPNFCFQFMHWSTFTDCVSMPAETRKP